MSQQTGHSCVEPSLVGSLSLSLAVNEHESALNGVVLFFGFFAVFLVVFFLTLDKHSEAAILVQIFAVWFYMVRFCRNASPWFLKVRPLVPQGQASGSSGSGPWFLKVRPLVPQGQTPGSSGSGPWFLKVRLLVPQGQTPGSSRSGSWFIRVRPLVPRFHMVRPLVCLFLKGEAPGSPRVRFLSGSLTERQNTFAKFGRFMKL